MLKKCDSCQREFDTKFTWQHYCCEACRLKEQVRRYQDYRSARKKTLTVKKSLAAEAMLKATGQPVKSLPDYCREAAECGLDYGTYRGLLAQGKTFDELKANANNNYTAAHARSYKAQRARCSDVWGRKIC